MSMNLLMNSWMHNASHHARKFRLAEAARVMWTQWIDHDQAANTHQTEMAQQRSYKRTCQVAHLEPASHASVELG